MGSAFRKGGEYQLVAIVSGMQEAKSSHQGVKSLYEKLFASFSTLPLRWRGPSSDAHDDDEIRHSMLHDEDSDAERGTSARRSRSGGTSPRPAQGARGKLKRSETARPFSSAEKSARSPNIQKTSLVADNSEDSSKEESSTARLSRRSSVLGDLFALFRRSSSFGLSGRFPPSGAFRDNDDMDDSDDEEANQAMSKEKLLEAIRQKKEIIGKVRLQPWHMKRKRRALKVARRQVQRHEAQVSKWHLYKVEFQRRTQQFLRWLANTSIYLIPWEAKIKRIESHFGSVVSSYFIFLRWILGLNITMSFILMFFITIPEWLADSKADAGRLNRTRHMKIIPAKDLAHADELNTVLDFGGYLQYSYLFYGYYSSETFIGSIIQYHVPIAYFCVNLFLLAFCLFIILKKMTSNTRTSKLSGGKQEQYVFTWKTVNGWDYNIGNSETSASLFKANVIKMREAIAEYNKKIKQKWTWLSFFTRLVVNIVIFSMFALSVYLIYQVAQITEKDTFIKQNAVSITVALITLLFPPIFELILKLESYRPRTALRIHLFRVLFFYLVNYFTLVYSLFIMLNNLEAEMRANELNQLMLQQTDTFQIVHNPYTYNKTYYEIVPSRSSRGLRRGRIKRPSKNGTTNGNTTPQTTEFYYTNDPTTPAPPLPWTTVYPNYGPFGVGVYNPKAILIPKTETYSKGTRTKNGKNSRLSYETVYESRAIGPGGDWSPSAKTTQGPVVLNYTSSPRIRYSQAFRASNYDELCWETLIGQEIAKIVTTDLVLTIVAILVIDFLRGLWIRYCSVWWCWNLETTFPEYAEFKVAENVLHLVNNQGMIWLGIILVPMLPMINNVKLIILMYIRAWACMTCNVPAKQIFRASRSSNFYLWLLLMMLCMSTLPVGFVIASKKPSKNCGPFSNQERFYSVIGEVLHNNLPKNIVDVIQYIMSPGIVIPILLLMLLIIYFLVLLVSGLRAANTDLSKQLTHERTEEKKKIFELAGGGRKRPSQWTTFSHRPSDFKLNGGGKSGSRSASRSNSKPRDSGSDGTRYASAEGDGHSQSRSAGGGSGTTPVRSSWHGLPTTQAQSGNAAAESDRLPRFQKRGQRKRHTPLFQASDDQLQSPTKSPISPTRHLTFLPSLQSVTEDEIDEEEGETQHTVLQKDTIDEAGENNTEMEKSQQSKSSSEPVSEEKPIPFTWRQRFLVCVGLADPEKIDRERAQAMLKRAVMAQAKRESIAAHADVEAGRQRKSRSGSNTAIRARSRGNIEVPQVIEPEPAEENDEDEEEDSVISPLLQPPRRHRPTPLLEEADYSVPSDDEADDEAEYASRANEPMQTNFPSSDERASGSSRSRTRSPYYSDNDTMIHVEKPGPSGISSHSPRPVGNLLELPLQPTKRSISLNDRKLLNAPNVPEPDVMSDSSPVTALRPRLFDAFQANQLAPEKRSPLPLRLSQEQMAPTPPRHGRYYGEPDDMYIAQRPYPGEMESSGRRMPESALLDRAERSNRMQTSDDPTRPPSEESFRDPTLSDEISLPYYTSNVNDPGVLSESFHYADPRLSYADPYSSYAAAMCSPISSTDFPSSERETTQILPSGHVTIPIARPSREGSRRQKLSDSPRRHAQFVEPEGRPVESDVGETQQISPILRRLGRPSDDGGSTSGRGTMPPGGYTTSPSGSSPEFGRAKFRISSSPTRPRNERDGESSDASIRRFNIRQKSALGSPGGISSGVSEQRKSPPPQSGTAPEGPVYSQQTTV